MPPSKFDGWQTGSFSEQKLLQVPKDEKFLDSRRMGKQLKKLVKGIKPGDQMMVVGTSNAPWLAKRGKFLKSFQTHIYIPPMEYGTRSFVWNKTIMEINGVDRRFEVSCLPKISDHFKFNRLHCIFYLCYILVQPFVLLCGLK